MEQIFHLLQLTYTSNDNNELQFVIDQFSLLQNQLFFYQILNQIISDKSQDSNIRLAALLQFKNIIHFKWEHLSKEIKLLIFNSFFFNIISSCEHYVMIQQIIQITDLLVMNDEFNFPWDKLLLQNIETCPMVAIIVANSLLGNAGNEFSMEIVLNIFSLMMNNLTNNQDNEIFIKISLKFIKNSIVRINFEETHLLFIINFVLNYNLVTVLPKSISIISKIANFRPDLIHNFEVRIVDKCVQNLNIPKVSINFFKMLSIFSQNNILWEPFKKSFIQLFIPYFSIDESSTKITDPSQFICDHFFDSFSSSCDPCSAAYRCLEVIGQYQKSSIIEILTLLKRTLEKDINNIYSVAHMASTILNQFVSNDMFNYVFSLLTNENMFKNNNDNNRVLIKCGLLIILQFESFSIPNPNHVLKCFELMLNERDELIQYFAANVLNETVPCLQNLEFLDQIPIDIVIPKILGIAQKFGLPRITDFLKSLFEDQKMLMKIESFSLEMANATFSLAHFYSEFAPDSISIASIFSLILTLITNLRQTRIEQDLCKLCFVHCTQLIKPTFLLPVLEIMFVSIYYSPLPFEDMWSAIAIISPLVNDISPVTREIAFRIFATIALKDINGLLLRSNDMVGLATFVIGSFDINEFSQFAAVLLRYNILPNELISTLMVKLFAAWENDEIDFFDDIFDFLAIVFTTNLGIFFEVFESDMTYFLERLTESAKTRDLMLIFPLIANILNPEQRNEMLSQIETDSNGPEELVLDNHFSKSAISLPRITLFDDNEINQAFFKFINLYS